MLMRNQMTSFDTDADFTRPGMVALAARIRVVVIKHSIAILTWRTGEQRERK